MLCPGEHIVSVAGHSVPSLPQDAAVYVHLTNAILLNLQEAMDEDAAPLPLAPGRAKADSLAVLLGQALRAGDQALLEKCAPFL